MNYLNEYISSLKMVVLPDQKTIIVDKASLFKYISPALLKQNNLSEDKLLNSASYENIPSIKQIASSCVSEDLECVETRSEQRYITSQNHDGEIQLYLKQKTPIINPTDGEVVGVRVDFFPIYSLGHFKPYIDSHISKFESAELIFAKRQKISLTEIEELILFLMILYAKPKIVTNQLNEILGKDNSVSTVRNIIHQQLLRKFEVLNVEELIDKAIFLGYDTILPRIMAEQFSIRIL